MVSRSLPVRLVASVTFTSEVPLMPPEGVTEHQSLSATETPQSPVALTERATVCASKVTFTLAGLTVSVASEVDGTGSVPHPQEKLKRAAAQSSSNPFMEAWTVISRG